MSVALWRRVLLCADAVIVVCSIYFKSRVHADLFPRFLDHCASVLKCFCDARRPALEEERRRCPHGAYPTVLTQVQRRFSKQV